MSFRINTNVIALDAYRNLSNTSDALAQSVARLSSGKRINSAADDPAGLIASLHYVAQLGGITQALQNNQDAQNYAKTAEGSLNEVNNLLNQARSLAVSSSNDATLTSDQRAANQTQINTILASIDRIGSTAKFGTKNILDGSAGVQASITDATDIKSLSIGGKIGTQAVTAAGAVAVNVTTAAAQATTLAAATFDVANGTQAGFLAAQIGAGRAGSFAINGHSYTFTATSTNQDVFNAINNSQSQTGVRAQIIQGSGGAGHFTFQLTANAYGGKGDFTVVDSSGVVTAAAATSLNTATPSAGTTAGVNAVASVTLGALTAVTFTGGQNGNDGNTLTDSAGNSLVLNPTGTGNHVAAAQVTVGSSQFQIGANGGETANLSLSAISQSALSLSGLDITTATNASNAIATIDSAISTVANQRGNIGAFIGDTINTQINSLNVAQENLAATNSSVIDTNLATETINYTKLQILQQSGISILAQANSAPQAVLKLIG